MKQQGFTHPKEAAIALLNEHEIRRATATNDAEGRRAQYRAAEVDAWDQWEKHGKSNETAHFWSTTAWTIADEFSVRPEDTQQDDNGESGPHLIGGVSAAGSTH